MPFPHWPADLPAPTVAGFSESRQNARKERTGETGPVRFRRKFTAVAKGVPMQCVCTLTQMQELEHFFVETLREGSLPFVMADYLRTGAPLADQEGAILLTDDGNPISMVRNVLCVFGEPPVPATASGSTLRIAFSIWQLPT